MHNEKHEKEFKGESVSAAGADPPDGGLRAWLVVVGGFLTYFCTFGKYPMPSPKGNEKAKKKEGRRMERQQEANCVVGMLNAFGTFQVYYQTHFLSDKSSSEISWIGTLQVFLLFIGGMFIGPLFDRMGLKVLFIPGALTCVLALIFTSLCTEYYQFILAQGLMFGIGNAMLFYPTISVMSHWFAKRRGLALGVVVAGSSLGGIAWPLILQRLFGAVGFGWTLRISAFICLGILAPCCYLVASRLPPAKGEIPQDELTGMFKDVIFMSLVAGEFFVMWGMFIPFYYLPLYAISRGVDETFSNDLVSILNAGSLIGRIAAGLGADKIGMWVQSNFILCRCWRKADGVCRYNATFLCALCSGVVLFTLQLEIHQGPIVAFAVLYGFFSGGLLSLQTGCVAQVTRNLQTIGARIGILMSISSVGVLTGAPIGGALVSYKDGSFEGLINFSGAILLAGTAIVALSRWLQNKRFLAKV